MKKWLERCPVFVKKLWCRLAISYTLLAFCAMMLLVVTIYGANDYSDFHKTLTLTSVEERVASEKLTLAQVIRDSDNPEWSDRARDNIREKLMNIGNSSGPAMYNITNSSRPEVYIQITDSNDRLLMSDPAVLPKEIANEFNLQKTSPSKKNIIKWRVENESIWIDMPITDSDGGMIGRARILFIAKFDRWIQLQSILDFLLFTWGFVFLLCVPIGIACGLIASRYVTKELQKMNEVTESWRQGNFDLRIALPNDDVLIRHSKHLNDMAHDLEMYMSLKQLTAVSEERNRVARELHDTVKQKLFALGLQLATAKSKPPVMTAAREHILEAEAITREAQHDLMEIITQLRPAGTSDTSLYDRIGMIGEDFRRRFDVSIELKQSEPVQCNSPTEHNVLRIVQESLMNAVRHGAASKIVIESKIDSGIATLTITDDGSGFNAEKETQGFGIISMRDRARDLLGGAFEIKSVVGEGTQITLSWKNEL